MCTCCDVYLIELNSLRIEGQFFLSNKSPIFFEESCFLLVIWAITSQSNNYNSWSFLSSIFLTNV